MANLSATRNHTDQPNTCYVCGQRILKSQSADYYHDDTGAGKHRSSHAYCTSSHPENLLKP